MKKNFFRTQKSWKKPLQASCTFSRTVEKCLENLWKKSFSIWKKLWKPGFGLVDTIFSIKKLLKNISFSHFFTYMGEKRLGKPGFGLVSRIFLIETFWKNSGNQQVFRCFWQVRNTTESYIEKRMREFVFHSKFNYCFWNASIKYL